MTHRELLTQAIFHIENDEWQKAHEIVQDHEGQYAFDRIHALLHRMEGDPFNASWWYKKLQMKIPLASFEDEIQQIKSELKL